MKKNGVYAMACVLVLGFMLLGCPTSGGGGDGTGGTGGTGGTTVDTSYTEADVTFQTISGTQRYYFAKSIDGLQKAADDNHLTLNPPLKNASWVLNTVNLDPAVKQAMAARNVDFCGTVTTNNGTVYIIANRKIGNDYYITQYR